MTTNRPKAGPKSKAAPVKENKSTSRPVGIPRPDFGKRYRAAAAAVDSNRQYGLEEAAALVVKTNPASFDAAVELHVHLTMEARGQLTLPQNTGRARRVAVFSSAVAAELAKGQINFEVLLATPDQMKEVAKFARLLGPKGLMPNPKSGTVTTDIKKAAQEMAAGRLEYRTDSGHNIHLVIGRASSKPEDLTANAAAVVAALEPFIIKSVTLATTMGPAISVLTASERRDNLKR